MILMLCHPYPNYIPDLLLHGLRKVSGDAVVDYPRKDILYQGTCGQPHLDLVPDFMADDSRVDRTDIAQKLKAGFFDLVFCDVRAFRDHLPLLQQSTCRLALIDGEDAPAGIPCGPYVILRRETDGSGFSIPLPMALPVEVMTWIDKHRNEPKTHSVGFLGSRNQHTLDRNVMLDEIAKLFPDALLQSWGMDGGWHGRDDYYRAMQSCRVVLTLPGAGYDTFRYWEHAACNAAHISKTMPLFIPYDFRDSREIVRFSTVPELAVAIERILEREGDWQAFADRSRAWLLRHHTTEQRARQTLDKVRAAFLM